MDQCAGLRNRIWGFDSLQLYVAKKNRITPERVTCEEQWGFCHRRKMRHICLKPISHTDAHVCHFCPATN